MEVIVKGEGWERKVQAEDINDAVGMVVQGREPEFMSEFYTVSIDGGKTERRVRWDCARWRSFPVADGALTAREFVETHPSALRDLAEFALDHDSEPGVGGVGDLGLQLASLVMAEQGR